jgi:Na+/proline symporter
MTPLLVSTLGIIAVFGLYLATISGRQAQQPCDFVDGGQALPPWVVIFAGAGIALASLGLADHLVLLSTFGLQYNQIAVGLIVVALCAALTQKRIWLAARLTNLRTLGDLLGDYFGSTALRIFMLVVLFLFSIPFAAMCLAQAGALVGAASGSEIPPGLAIWAITFALFVSSVIGGWRGIAYVVAAQSLLVIVLVMFLGGFTGFTVEKLAFAAGGIGTSAGILPDKIPGVIQFTAGIGKAPPIGGTWTAFAGLTFALSLAGIAISPGFSFLGITSKPHRAFAFSQVWMIAGVTAGALMLVGPVLAAEIASGGSLTAFMSRLATVDQMAGVGFAVLLVGSALIAVAFFTGSGACVCTIELTSRYIVPGMDQRTLRFAARVALAAVYAAVAVVASYAPLSATIFSSLTLSLSAQLLPAVLGLCWVRWISRSGVLTGLIVGTLFVVFTESFGLILFERLFVELPWGRWPFSMHSAGWGLIANFTACLLVSLFTRSDAGRDRRDRLHEAFEESEPARLGSPAATTAKWSLTLLWAFFALGPGAILGNTFFSEPIFAGTVVAPGVPSLLIWQVLFWFVGIFIVWWLAYRGRFSVIDDLPRHRIKLVPDTNPLFQPITTPWIARLLNRVTGR